MGDRQRRLEGLERKENWLEASNRRERERGRGRGRERIKGGLSCVGFIQGYSEREGERVNMW